MEGKNQAGSSSFSLTSELFGSKDSSSSSSSGIFGSIFPPPSKVLGADSKTGTADGNTKWNQRENKSTSSKDVSSNYQQLSVEPSNYSSSIYYGGQDVYQPPKAENAGSNPLSKKDGDEDDSANSASRGNWWQGSLYY